MRLVAIVEVGLEPLMLGLMRMYSGLCLSHCMG
jgi:hypothetical protein